jgi:phosphocarrier protein FPr
MVGLVLVSHSRALAEALLQMLKQVSSPDAKVAIAAGVGPERLELGTDAVEIAEAIQSVFGPDGVVVLMDLGSAILSSEMALELLPEEMRPGIRFCAAPFVEGAIAAAVQAGLGNDLQTVCQEALNALLPKLQQLGEEGEAAAPAAAGQAEAKTSAPGDAPLEKTLTLQNEHGLHARPATRFVQLSRHFDADVQVRNLTKGKGPATAKSLTALATLAAARGDEIAISARGPQAHEALEALSRLVDSNFGEAAK